jgi:hypothetical protein
MKRMIESKILRAMQQARQDTSGIIVDKKVKENTQEDSDIFPSETFKFANANWLDVKVIGDFAFKNVIDWTKKDFLNYVKHLYFEKFVTELSIPPAYGYMYLNVIEEICSKNFPDSNIKLLKARYISWYFENHVLTDTVKYRNWNIKKMVSPKVVASFILESSGSNVIGGDKMSSAYRLPVNESLLNLYFRGDPKDFIKNYGIIIPFAFSFFSKKFTWEDSFDYISSAVKDFVCVYPTNANAILKKSTEQYSPYNKKFEKIMPERILAVLFEKTGVNLTGVKIF